MFYSRSKPILYIISLNYLAFIFDLTALTTLFAILSGMIKSAGKLDVDVGCCIFQPAFGWCGSKMLVKICNLNVFNGKKLKIARNLQKQVFLSLHQNAGFFPKKCSWSTSTNWKVQPVDVNCWCWKETWKIIVYYSVKNLCISILGLIQQWLGYVSILKNAQICCKLIEHDLNEII